MAEQNNVLAQGRIVWTNGNLFEGQQKTDFTTKQPVIGNDGQPVKQYGFGLAIPKIDPATGQHSAGYVEIYQKLQAEALTLFPSGNLPPDFSMKFKDGDAVDHQGKPFSDREGYAGHIVLACTTQIPIKFFIHEGGNNMLVNTGFKCGDYVNVQLNIKAHAAKGQGKAGLYVNPSAVQLIQAGKEIVNTPSGDQIFGQAPVAAYAGQMVADVAPAMPGQAPVAPMQPQAPVAPAMQPQAPVAPAQAAPNYGVLPQTMQPQAPMGNLPPAGQPPAQPAAQPQTQYMQPPAGMNPQVNTYAQPAAPVNPTLPGQAPAMPPMGMPQ